MNDLSWLIYFAGISGSLKVACITFALIAIFGGGFLFLISRDGIMFEQDKAAAISKAYKKTWLPSFIAILIAVFMPSKNTIYAIAASEMGEEIVKSETAGKAVKALDNWLDKQIDEPTQTNQRKGINDEY